MLLELAHWLEQLQGLFGLFNYLTFRSILAALTEEGWIAETGQIDSSYIKAHRSAGGAKGGRGPMPLASRVEAGQRRSTRWPSAITIS